MVHPQPEVHMSAFSSGNIPHELLEALLGNPYESQILVDADGIVRYMSPSYETFYQLSQLDAIGRPLLELIPHSKVPRVLKTGHAEIGRLFRMGDKERIIARIPLRDGNGKIVGAVGKLMFPHPEKIKESGTPGGGVAESPELL